MSKNPLLTSLYKKMFARTESSSRESRDIMYEKRKHGRESEDEIKDSKNFLIRGSFKVRSSVQKMVARMFPNRPSAIVKDSCKALSKGGVLGLPAAMGTILSVVVMFGIMCGMAFLVFTIIAPPMGASLVTTLLMHIVSPIMTTSTHIVSPIMGPIVTPIMVEFHELISNIEATRLRAEARMREEYYRSIEDEHRRQERDQRHPEYDDSFPDESLLQVATTSTHGMDAIRTTNGMDATSSTVSDVSEILKGTESNGDIDAFLEKKSEKQKTYNVENYIMLNAAQCEQFINGIWKDGGNKIMIPQFSLLNVEVVSKDNPDFEENIKIVDAGIAENFEPISKSNAAGTGSHSASWDAVIGADHHGMVPDGAWAYVLPDPYYWDLKVQFEDSGAMKAQLSAGNNFRPMGNYKYTLPGRWDGYTSTALDETARGAPFCQLYIIPNASPFFFNLIPTKGVHPDVKSAAEVFQDERNKLGANSNDLPSLNWDNSLSPQKIRDQIYALGTYKVQNKNLYPIHYEHIPDILLEENYGTITNGTIMQFDKEGKAQSNVALPGWTLKPKMKLTDYMDLRVLDEDIQDFYEKHALRDFIKRGTRAEAIASGQSIKTSEDDDSNPFAGMSLKAKEYCGLLLTVAVLSYLYVCLCASVDQEAVIIRYSEGAILSPFGGGWKPYDSRLRQFFGDCEMTHLDRNYSYMDQREPIFSCLCTCLMFCCQVKNGQMPGSKVDEYDKTGCSSDITEISCFRQACGPDSAIGTSCCKMTSNDHWRVWCNFHPMQAAHDSTALQKSQVQYVLNLCGALDCLTGYQKDWVSEKDKSDYFPEWVDKHVSYDWTWDLPSAVGTMKNYNQLGEAIGTDILSGNLTLGEVLTKLNMTAPMTPSHTEVVNTQDSGAAKSGDNHVGGSSNGNPTVSFAQETSFDTPIRASSIGPATVGIDTKVMPHGLESMVMPNSLDSVMNPHIKANPHSLDSVVNPPSNFDMVSKDASFWQDIRQKAGQDITNLL